MVTRPSRVQPRSDVTPRCMARCCMLGLDVAALSVAHSKSGRINDMDLAVEKEELSMMRLTLNPHSSLLNKVAEFVFPCFADHNTLKADPCGSYCKNNNLQSQGLDELKESGQHHTSSRFPGQDSRETCWVVTASGRVQIHM